MKFTCSRSIALISLVVLGGVSADASTSPSYGGTLRVELHDLTASMDPREWRTGTTATAVNEKLVALVFDRLVTLDNCGRFQPQLATEWSHDAAFKKWQFTLRSNVKFSDGTLLNAADVAAALQPLLLNGQQITASGNSVVVQSTVTMPDLLEELASGRFVVYRVQPNGTLMGTGPFLVAETGMEGRQPPRSAAAVKDSEVASAANGASGTMHLHFRANEETWSGRPFLDAIEVTLGVPPLRQLFDLQLGKADLVELSPDLVRRAAQENLRVWASAPVTLYGLRFDDAQPASADARLREALALSLDRHTMANVLLQKQAEPAAALLPQWLSGYAFLFTMGQDIERAKEIRAALPAAGKEPLRLRVDASGDLAKLLGERVAVNTRQAAIPLQVVNRPVSRGGSAAANSNDTTAGVHLFAWHYSSLSSRVELESFVSTLNLGESSGSAVSSTDPEQLYAWERKLLEERRVLPLVVLPEYVGLGLNVRDWMPARWGEWHLADVWLTVPEASAAQRGNSNATGPGAKP
jgi:peptide/nickel transport system substrate-binding protein